MNNKEKEILQKDDIEADFKGDKRNINERLGGIMKDSKYRVVIIVALCVFLAALAFALFAYNRNRQATDAPDNVGDIAEQSESEKIRINEYVVSNNNTFRDDKFQSPDWIEIYNYGDEPVWLGNFFLSDTEDDPVKFRLPDVSLLPNEYLLVLASGSTDADDLYVRAPFRLGNNDKKLLLSTTEHTVSIVDIEQMPTDISAGYFGDDFGYFAYATPGDENTTQMYDDWDIAPQNPYENLIIINEYLPANSYGILDNDGHYSDWIELYNPNEYAVFAGDLFLSDDENQGNKFRLPDIQIEPKGFLVVFASGKAGNATEQIHAPFKLGTGDSKIVLSYKNGLVISSCDVYDLPRDVSAGVGSNGSFGFFCQPTPNGANDTLFYESADNLCANYASSFESPIVINEWMSNNQFGILDAHGDASDWIELYNVSSQSVSLGGYAITDSYDDLLKWEFPSDAQIEANSYLVIYASGKNKTIDGQMHISFALGDDETLYLVKSGEGIADEVELEYLPGNVSRGKTADGYGYFALPTPGKENTTAFVAELKHDISFLNTDLYISEVASGKIHSNRAYGQYMYEYIEIYNDSDVNVNLAGYTLEENQQSSYTFENASIKPNGYLLVSVKGYIPGGVAAIQSENISLNSAGERLYIKNPDGVIVDCFDTGYLLGSYSSGRVAGIPETRVFFMQKTPGEKNSSVIYTSYSTEPQFSMEGGVCDEAFFLSITADIDATIYYTLDGSIPNDSSKMYTESIAVTKDMVVRAIGISTGKLPSLCTTRTYILSRQHDIPVFCISTAPAGMFYDNSGIYAGGPGYGVGEYPYFSANYFWNVERMAAFEVYEENGQIALAFDGGIQIAGGYSRANDQKSLAIRLRDEYGLSEVTYPFFDEGVNTFKHLFLRNGGQDSWQAKMRDVFIQNCAQELENVDSKRGRPVAVYINGQYWGLYNLRDKLNADHFRIKYDLDDDTEINILTEYSSPKSGSDEDWLDLKAFCYSHDFSIEENYNKLAERVDVDSFIDYIVVETFFGNADTHNINFWKPEIEGGKWRPVLFDLDMSIYDLGYSMVDDYLNNYLGYHDFVLVALKQSDIFKKQLLERYSYLICNVYTEEYLLNAIDKYADEMASEMQNHVQRWSSPYSYSSWERNVENLKVLMIGRREDIVGELHDYFELTDEQAQELFPYSGD